MNKIKLPKQDRENWLIALREGGYKQNRGFLKNQNKYCCLGVFCDIKGLDGLDFETLPRLLDNCKDLPYPIIGSEEYVKERFPEVNEDNFASYLAELNDEGKTFTEIADIIEELTIGV